MSAPAPPSARALPSWTAVLRTLGRAVAIQVWSGMVAWRWLLLSGILAAVAFLSRDSLSASFYNTLDKPRIDRAVDAWDLFPFMVTDFRIEYLLFGFGFLLFIADTYQGARDQGTVTMALVRLPSRSLYWLGTMGGVAVLAFGFVSLAFVISLLVGMILVPSSSLWPMLPRPNLDYLAPSWHLPAPVYSLLLVGYVSWALWVTGCATVLLSLLVRRRVVVLAAIMLWTALSMYFYDYELPFRVLRLLNIGYLVGFFKHLSKRPFPAGEYFAVTGAALALMALVGAFRLRREEL